MMVLISYDVSTVSAAGKTRLRKDVIEYNRITKCWTNKYVCDIYL